MDEELQGSANEAVAAQDSKVEPVAETQVRKVSNFDDLPSISRRSFRFSRDGCDYELSYTPLTYEQIEQIRAELFPPKAPTRLIPGLEDAKPKELYQRKTLGLPLYEPDEDDPQYKAALVKYNNDVKIEQLRRALGWEMPRDQFLTEIRKRLYPGELQSLMDEIDSHAWSVNSSLVDRFFETFLNPQTPTEGDSPKNTSD